MEEPFLPTGTVGHRLDPVDTAGRASGYILVEQPVVDYIHAGAVAACVALPAFGPFVPAEADSPVRWEPLWRSASGAFPYSLLEAFPGRLEDTAGWEVRHRHHWLAALVAFHLLPSEDIRPVARDTVADFPVVAGIEVPGVVGATGVVAVGVVVVGSAELAGQDILLGAFPAWRMVVVVP